MDTIYLHYLTHKESKQRMKRDAFMKMCAMHDFNTLAIQAFFAKEGWVFDDNYVFTFQEAIDHIHARFNRMHLTLQRFDDTGFGQPCEGRR